MPWNIKIIEQKTHSYKGGTSAVGSIDIMIQDWTVSQDFRSVEKSSKSLSVKI